MELGQVRAPVPVYGQLGQLVQGPVIPLVAAAELLNVEIGRHGVGVDVQALGKKVLALLGVILCLEAVVQDFLRADTHPIGRVGHLVDARVRKIYRPVLHPFRGAAHENKILLVRNRPVQHLPAVFQPLSQKRLLIVPGCGDADQQFIGIGFHGLLEKVVLLRLLKGVNLIADGDVRVQGILAVWVGGQGPDIKRAVSQVRRQAVLVVVVDDPHRPTVLGILSHPAHVVCQEVIGFHGLHEGRRSNVHFGARAAI